MSNSKFILYNPKPKIHTPIKNFQLFISYFYINKIENVNLILSLNFINKLSNLTIEIEILILEVNKRIQLE